MENQQTYREKQGAESSEQGGQGVEATGAPQETAFYFYYREGQPVIRASRNLVEFAAAVSEVDSTCIQFHVERGDFDPWLRALGEPSLANQIAELRGRSIPAEELRTEVGLAVASRINQQRRQGKEQGQAAARSSSRTSSRR